MKTKLAAFFASVSIAFATGWDQRVDYYCSTNVPIGMYAISEVSGVYTVTKWDAEKIGKTQPTIAKLTENDAAVDAWVRTLELDADKQLETKVKAALLAVCQSYNAKLPAQYRITWADFKTNFATNMVNQK